MSEERTALTREQAIEFAERWFDRKWGNLGQYQSLMETMVARLMALKPAEAALRAETPTLESVNQKWLLDAAKQVIKELGASEELDSDTFRWLKDAIYYVEKEVANEARAETPAPREPWADINWDRLPVRWRQINGVRVDAETIAKWFFQVDDKRQRELEWLVEAACGVAQRVAAGEPEQAK